MSSKKFAKSNIKKTEKADTTTYSEKSKVWLVRIVIVLLCVAVAVTLIPSIFF